MVRWSFGRWRRTDRPASAAADAHDTGSVPADADDTGSPDDAAAEAAAGFPVWLRRPPMRPTISWHAPLTIDLTTEPSAVRTRWRPRRGTVASAIAVPAGWVGGVVGVSAMDDVDLSWHAEVPMPGRLFRRRLARYETTPVITPGPLTEAAPPYVGQPVAPVEPFIPALALDDVVWDEPAEDGAHGLGAGDPAVFDPLGLLAIGVAELAAAPGGDDQPPPPPTVLRRATLAQSRRLGLGMTGPEPARPAALPDGSAGAGSGVGRPEVDATRPSIVPGPRARSTGPATEPPDSPPAPAVEVARLGTDRDRSPHRARSMPVVTTDAAAAAPDDRLPSISGDDQPEPGEQPGPPRTPLAATDQPPATSATVAPRRTTAVPGHRSVTGPTSAPGRAAAMPDRRLTTNPTPTPTPHSTAPDQPPPADATPAPRRATPMPDQRPATNPTPAPTPHSTAPDQPPATHATPAPGRTTTVPGHRSVSGPTSAPGRAATVSDQPPATEPTPAPGQAAPERAPAGGPTPAPGRDSALPDQPPPTADQTPASQWSSASSDQPPATEPIPAPTPRDQPSATGMPPAPRRGSAVPDHPPVTGATPGSSVPERAAERLSGGLPAVVAGPVQRAAAGRSLPVALSRPLAYRDVPRGGGLVSADLSLATVDDPGVEVAPVPHAIAEKVGRVHAIDLSGTMMYRGQWVSGRANHLGARAFTEAGSVFLPVEAGRLGDPDTDALLAHELTHVAQQRELGANLPGEDTELGRRLETEAVAVERWFGGGPEPSPLRHIKLSQPTTMSTVRQEVVVASPDPAAMSDQDSLPRPTGWSPSQGFTFGHGHVHGAGAAEPGRRAVPKPGGAASTKPTAASPDGEATVPVAAVRRLLELAEVPIVSPAGAGPGTVAPTAQPVAGPPSVGDSGGVAAVPVDVVRVLPTEAVPVGPAGLSATPDAAAERVPARPPDQTDGPVVPAGEIAAAPESVGVGLAPAAVVEEVVARAETAGGDSRPTGVGPELIESAAVARLAGTEQTGTAEPVAVVTVEPAVMTARAIVAVPSAPDAHTEVAEPSNTRDAGTIAATRENAGSGVAEYESAVGTGNAGTISAEPGTAVGATTGHVIAVGTRPVVAAPAIAVDAGGPVAFGPVVPAALIAEILAKAESGATTVPAAALADVLASAAEPTPADGPVIVADEVAQVLALAAPRTIAPEYDPTGGWPTAEHPQPPPAPVASMPMAATPIAFETVAQTWPASVGEPTVGVPTQRAVGALPTWGAESTWRAPVSWQPRSAEPLDGPEPADADLVSLVDQLARRIGDDPPRDWLDLANTEHLDLLAAKLYDRLHDRLRGEVLVARERAGSLLDPW